MNTTTTQESDPIGQTPTLPADPGPPAPQTTSLKQMEANRRNAQKSTGPTTPTGRAASKMNALKHGIFSKQVLVKAANFRESSDELYTLHERFWMDLNPVGPVEEMLVDQIVATHWRWRRALQAESGEIALSVDATAPKQKLPPENLILLWQSLPDPISSMEESVWGLRILEHRLHQVRKEVEQRGELTPAVIQALVQALGGQPNRLTERMEEIRSRCNENPDGLSADALPPRKKQRTLDLVGQELESLELKREVIMQREDAGEASRRAAAVLPSRPVVDKLVRYETMLERQLYQAMAQLKRLQLRRQGEMVSPPLMVDVSG